MIALEPKKGYGMRKQIKVRKLEFANFNKISFAEINSAKLIYEDPAGVGVS